MYCPECGKEQLCGCSSCGNWGKIVQREMESDILACGWCGYAMHICYWDELSIEQALEEAGVETLTELANKEQV